jgi:hypothetical protein
VFTLRRRGSTKHLATRGLIEFGLQAAAVDRLEETRSPQARHVPRIFRHFKTYSDMALCPQVIDLLRLNIVDKGGYLLGICQVSIMQKESGAGVMWGDIEVVDPVDVERTRVCLQSLENS